MKLLACMKKDIRLISGGGVKSLLLLILPAALFMLVISFMGGLTSINTYTEPFPIAVHDEDETWMSAALLNQLKKVSLFNKVIKADASQADEEFLEMGCAAVVTIPKDFFYHLYDMEDTGIRMVLNGKMPKEANAVRSAVSAIVSILEQNQRLFSAAARIRYGELTEGVQAAVYRDYSSTSVNDLLLRLEYFSIDSLYENEALSQMVFFAAGICSMFLLFFPLCVLRSLYEEKELGITSRLFAGGGNTALLLSKLIVSFLLTAVSVTAVLRIIRLPGAASLASAFILLFLASFSFFFLLSLLCRSPERTQMVGNVLILIMLIAGGALFPFRLLPESIRPLSLATIPYYVTRSLYAAALGKEVPAILKTIWPVIVSIPVFALAAGWLYSRRRKP